MSFLSNNVQSDTDVSVMVKASSAGKKKQMTLADTNILELKDSEINTLEEFEEMHGAYLVVGYLYAGEILFESRYSAANSEDKTAIEGGLAYVITIHSLYSLFSVHTINVTPSSHCQTNLCVISRMFLQRFVQPGWIRNWW